MRQAITVWKDGTWKVWQRMDAQLAEDETDWLVTIPVTFWPEDSVGRVTINRAGTRKKRRRLTL